MRIYTRVIIDPNGDVLEQEGYEYDGPVAECKGASQQERDQAAAQTSLAKKQSAFFDTMSKSYDKMFAGQTAILESLQKTYAPILAAGPSQYGLSRAEDTAMRTMASEGTAQSYKMAKQAVAEGQAAASGDAYIPKGADTQVRAQLASQAAAQQSAGNLGITARGYDIGRQNFANAANALGGVAQQMNPLGYSQGTSGAAGTAGTIGNEAFGMYRTIYDQDKASSGWGIAGSLLGAGLGIAGTVLGGPIGGAIGGKIGGALGGGGKPAYDSSFGTGNYAAPPSGSAPSGNIFGN